VPEAALGWLALPEHRALRFHAVRVVPDGQMNVPDSPSRGPSPSALWERVHLPKRLAALGVHGYHALGFCAFPVPRRQRDWALVTTVHGLEPFMVPESFEPSWVSYARETIRRGVDESDAVITVSERVREEVVETFDVARERVVAIPHGTDRIDPAATRGTGEPGPAYAVWCGAIEERKNLAAVLAAWAPLKRRHGLEPALRVVGWNWGEKRGLLRAGAHVDVVIEPKINAWKGRVSVEGVLRDVRVGG